MCTLTPCIAEGLHGDASGSPGGALCVCNDRPVVALGEGQNSERSGLRGLLEMDVSLGRDGWYVNPCRTLL